LRFIKGTFSEKTPNEKRRKYVGFKGCWYFGGTFEKQQKRGRKTLQPLDFERFSLKNTVDAVLALR